MHTGWEGLVEIVKRGDEGFQGTSKTILTSLLYKSEITYSYGAFSLVLKFALMVPYRNLKLLAYRLDSFRDQSKG